MFSAELSAANESLNAVAANSASKAASAGVAWRVVINVVSSWALSVTAKGNSARGSAPIETDERGDRRTERSIRAHPAVVRVHPRELWQAGFHETARKTTTPTA
jgi:hypothetical protein